MFLQTCKDTVGIVRMIMTGTGRIVLAFILAGRLRQFRILVSLVSNHARIGDFPTRMHSCRGSGTIPEAKKPKTDADKARRSHLWESLKQVGMGWSRFPDCTKWADCFYCVQIMAATAWNDNCRDDFLVHADHGGFIFMCLHSDVQARFAWSIAVEEINSNSLLSWLRLTTVWCISVRRMS